MQDGTKRLVPSWTSLPMFHFDSIKLWSELKFLLEILFYYVIKSTYSGGFLCYVMLENIFSFLKKEKEKENMFDLSASRV